jgi:hypothetical protein
MPSSLLQLVVNSLFQTCYNKLGTSSANTTCWQLVNRFVTTCLQTCYNLCIFTCVEHPWHGYTLLGCSASSSTSRFVHCVHRSSWTWKLLTFVGLTVVIKSVISMILVEEAIRCLYSKMSISGIVSHWPPYSAWSTIILHQNTGKTH